MIDIGGLSLSSREWARIAYGPATDTLAVELATRGLHATAPSDEPEYRRWLREYLRTGIHPLDVMTYDLALASWQERLACRDVLVLAIRQGRLSPGAFAILEGVASPYDRAVFQSALDSLWDWVRGDPRGDPAQYRRKLLNMADGHREDLP